MVEFPPSRQSSSYIPIRGWHSLISHIITLVRGALRSLVGTEEEGRLGTVCPERRDDGGRGKGGGGGRLTFPPGLPLGDRFTATLGTDSPVAATAARRLLLSEWTGATPGARERETTPGDTTCSFVRGRSREL